MNAILADEQDAALYRATALTTSTPLVGALLDLRTSWQAAPPTDSDVDETVLFLSDQLQIVPSAAGRKGFKVAMTAPRADVRKHLRTESGVTSGREAAVAGLALLIGCSPAHLDELAAASAGGRRARGTLKEAADVAAFAHPPEVPWFEVVRYVLRVWDGGAPFALTVDRVAVVVRAHLATFFQRRTPEEQAELARNPLALLRYFPTLSDATQTRGREFARQLGAELPPTLRAFFLDVVRATSTVPSPGEVATAHRIRLHEALGIPLTEEHLPEPVRELLARFKTVMHGGAEAGRSTSSRRPQ